MSNLNVLRIIDKARIDSEYSRLNKIKLFTKNLSNDFQFSLATSDDFYLDNSTLLISNYTIQKHTLKVPVLSEYEICIDLHIIQAVVMKPRNSIIITRYDEQ